MSEFQDQLIFEARTKYGEIFPCGIKTSLSECFTYECGKIILWFNTARDKSTRMVSIKIPEERC